MKNKTESKYYTVAEVAALLRFAPYSIYRLIKQDKIRAVRVGENSLRISEAELERYIRRS